MTKKKQANRIAAIVLAAGLGTRMKSALPKVLQPLCGRPMVNLLLGTLKSIATDETVVVVGPDMAAVADAVAPCPTARQAEQLGTANAVAAARERLRGFKGDVLICYADSPLILPETLDRMLAAKRSKKTPAIVVLGFRPREPGAYGRLVTAKGGELEAIVEAGEATEKEREIRLCNSGVMVVGAEHLFGLVEKVGCDNAKGEYYLTDIIALARGLGLKTAFVEGEADELIGINDRADLATAEAILQSRLRRRAMAAGATLIDPLTVYFSADTRLGRDVIIGPNVFFGPGVMVADNVEIKAFSHLEGASIAAGAVIGPFARLRPGAEVGRGARVGNFVEIKNAVLEDGAKANHLSYIGDARVGAEANIGAGTITCNYDGHSKARTDIGEGAFIGSNTALVAPVAVGAGAIVGAGSVITRDVETNSLAVARGRQESVSGWAEEFHKSKSAKKNKKKKG
jgi:bifunctional UDP-N-acetylglucosamine pyrophosphorylase/glucosamine-1-phosphate N-acetyltransferase